MKIFTIGGIFLTSISIAQVPKGIGVAPSGTLTGTHIKSNTATKRLANYTYLRENDVVWSKRVWRTIDLRQKLNHPLYYPLVPTSDHLSLWDVMMVGIKDEASLTPYELGIDLDDEFRYPVAPRNGNYSDPEFRKRLEEVCGYVETIPVFDPDTGEIIPEEFEDTIIPYTSKDIISYEIKEDWFFDKSRSVMDVRIIGISPVVYAENPVTGDIIGTRNLFWLYFPQCRYHFQNYRVHNGGNEAQMMSYDDLFWKRLFASYVHKESNIYGRAISGTWRGTDALLQGERIGKEIEKIESDVWHY